MKKLILLSFLTLIIGCQNNNLSTQSIMTSNIASSSNSKEVSQNNSTPPPSISTTSTEPVSTMNSVESTIENTYTIYFVERDNMNNKYGQQTLKLGEVIEFPNIETEEYQVNFWQIIVFDGDYYYYTPYPYLVLNSPTNLYLAPHFKLKADSNLSGEGTSDSPYLIFDKADLQAVIDVSSDYDLGISAESHFKLANNIDFGGNYFDNQHYLNQIRQSSFKGVFDFNNFYIYNFKTLGEEGEPYFDEEYNYPIQHISLFFENKGTIKNLVLSVSDNNQIVSYLAVNNRGIITDCLIEATDEITKFNNFTYNNYGEITNSKIIATSISAYLQGGITTINYGLISNCHFQVEEVSFDYLGYKEGSFWMLGGIAAINKSGTIENCSVKGTFKSLSARSEQALEFGGIVGENSAVVKNCYSDVRFEAAGKHVYVGGIAGYQIGEESLIINCFALVSASIVASGSYSFAGAIIGDIYQGKVAYSVGSIQVLSSSYLYNCLGGVIGSKSSIAIEEENYYFNFSHTINGGEYYNYHIGTSLLLEQQLDSDFYLSLNFDPSIWQLTEGEYPNLL